MAKEDAEAGVTGEDIPAVTFSSFDDKSIRLGFIRKVYGIVSVQLFISFAFVLVPVLSEPVRKFGWDNIWVLLIVSVVVFVASFIPLACCKIHRKFPYNFIFLGILTLSVSFLLFVVGTVTKPETVMYAVVTTAVVTVALTVFAFQTKIDFTLWYGLAYVSLCVLVIMGTIMIVVRNQILYIFYSAIGALIFSGYIVIDTQMIIGGSHSLQFSPEDYVFAALTLYVDIINLFLKILALFGGSK